MLIRNRRGTVRWLALAAFVAATLWSGSALAQTKQDTKCANIIGKMGAKLAKTINSVTAKCMDAVVAGNASGPCPDAKGLAKIDKIEAKLEASIVKSCQSTCSITPIPCISNLSCPPLATAAETCDGAGKKPFDVRNINYPGPLCPAVLNATLEDPEQIAQCAATLTSQVAPALTDALYGSLTMGALDDDPAAGCLSKVSKLAQKLSATIYKGAIKCRNEITSGKVIGNPATCTVDNVKVKAKIDKSKQKLADTITATCTNSDIQKLDLCGNGVGGTLDTTEATACLTEAASEITDTTALPADREFSAITLVEAAYPPPSGVCGDNTVNQTPHPFALLGEECDGTDDSACPGECLPPGDTFECTCATRPLIRFFADGFTADLDNGWRGPSHDSGVADGAGYVNEVHNCNCTELTGATCTGTTSDSVCDLTGFQNPSCSWDPLSTTTCDQHGNNNGVSENSDCWLCDDFSTNPGASCSNNSHCTPQCYDANDVPVGPCGPPPTAPSFTPRCPSGQVCRGRCDTSPTCFVVPNGAPLPISSGGTAVCVLTTFREDIFGTRDIVTGEHEVFIRQFSKVLLGASNSVPCAVCGGFCAGGPRENELCEGTCSTSGDSCRFDEDCPPGETCTTASPQCPNSNCTLSLVCGGGIPANHAIGNYGRPCRLEAYTRIFGTTSSDCQLNEGSLNITGQGLQINFFPSTSEAVSLPATLACQATGYELYDCPCPTAGGTVNTRPNACAGACNAGAELGEGCATGAGNINGQFTTCAGGANQFRACDEDSDCPGSTCSVNPRHCTGGPAADERKPCTGDVQCNGGTCVDACPSGRCVPLCLPGAVKGDPPAPDAEEGFCAAGPAFYHCSGEKDVFRTCGSTEAAGSCNAVCATSCTKSGNTAVPSGGSMAACDPLNPCAGGEVCCGDCELAKGCESGLDGLLGAADNKGDTDDNPGAGICVADIWNCFVNDAAAEGGDTLNGNGDPTNVKSAAAYCIAGTGNGAVDPTAGLGGPGRLRQRGVNIVNLDTIP